MAQAGFTPIQLYFSTTAAAVPTSGNLANGELAINITDGKLYYKSNAGVVTLLAGATAGPAGGSNTQVQFNSSGALAGSSNMTFDGTTLTANALTVTNAVTLSGGTANGVAYLNGSKVLTSGSALVFDGTNLGLGVTPSAWGGSFKAFQITSGGTSLWSDGSVAFYNRNTFYDGTNRKYVVNGFAQEYAQLNDGSHAWKITTSGSANGNITFTQAMTLDADGDLGIGTSSPNSKLQVNSGTNLGGVLIGFNGTSANFYDANTHYWRTGDATGRMELSQAGNLGLGVTPSAWSSSYKAISIGFAGGGQFAGGTANTQTLLSTNLVFTGTGATGWKLPNNVAGTNYEQYLGAHKWYNAPANGVNGDATLTQAMTLDASGRLGVGVTSPQFRLDVFRGSSGVVLNLDGENAYNAETGITLSSQRAKISGFLESSGGTPGSILRFYTMPNGGSVTQRMEITSNGLVGIGNITPGQVLDVDGNIRSRDGGFSLSTGTTQSGAFIQYNRVSGSGVDYTPCLFAETGLGMAFLINGTVTKAMSLTSAGNLLVGTTSSAGVARITVNGGSIISTSPTSSVSGTYSFSDNGGSPNNFRVYNDTDSNNTGNRFIICDAAASVLRAEIRTNGGLANYQANNVNLSDRREKTNFAPAKAYLDVICAIPVQTFNYIDQNHEEDGGLTLGVVAQDVQAVAPELVMESNWAGRDKEPKMRLSIYQTDLQYALMKCIQEQQAIIESLKARLDAANL